MSKPYTKDCRTRRRRLLVAVCLSLAYCATAFAIDGKILVGKNWRKLDSETLMQMGDKFGNQPDSALICYTIVANRYDENQRDEKELIQSVAAFNEIARLYLDMFYDIPTGYSYVLKAKELAEKHHLRRLFPYISINLAHIESLRSGIYEDEKYELIAMEHHIKAFHEAIDIREWRIISPTFINLAQTALKLDPERCRKEVETFSKLDIPENQFMVKYAKAFCKGMDAFLNHDTTTAIRLFGSLPIEQRTSNNQKAKLKMVASTAKREIFLKMRRDIDALAENDTILMLAERYDIPEGKLDVYQSLQQFYEDRNDRQQAEKYELLYLKGKDEINRRANLYGLDKARFLSDIRKMDEQMKDLSAKRKVQETVTWILSVFSLLLIVLLTMIFLNNIKIKRKNRMLYRKNVDLLAAEEKHREDMAAEKYKNSSLGDDYKEMMYKKILAVMESSDDIFSESFSMDKLSELVDGKKNNVSQVINQMYGNNFNAMLNDYRVREACRRMGDTAQYGHYTVEAIAQSVGFKSRSSFVAIFKRITGLTPSDYQKLAKKE